MKLFNKHLLLFIKHPAILWIYIKTKCSRVWIRIHQRFVWDARFAQIRDPKTKSMHVATYDNAQTIVNQLKEHGFCVETFSIVPENYHTYLQKACYEDYILYLNGGRTKTFPEKSLEHFIAASLLSLQPSDIYIDIANACSPTPEIYHRLFGCTTFRQDLEFPKGLRGTIIGGDAAAMPVPDAFATKMALHCSFEHFEQDADTRFIKETARILAPGGKLCILPLYMYTSYVIRSNPATLPPGGIAFDDDAIVSCEKGLLQRHSRFYDAVHLATRIKPYLNDMTLKIYHITNPKDINPSCYVTFAMVIEKKKLKEHRTI